MIHSSLKTEMVINGDGEERKTGCAAGRIPFFSVRKTYRYRFLRDSKGLAIKTEE